MEAARALPLCLLFAAAPLAYGETLRQSLEGGVELSVTFPDSVVAGERFSVSVLVENRGWEEKRDVLLEFRPDPQIRPPQSLSVGSVSEGGSHGATLGFSSSGPPATYYLNIDYSHVLLENNETPRAPFSADIAVPVEVKAGPAVAVATSAPESIFEDAEFPFGVSITPDSDIEDLEVRIVPPGRIEFSGKTRHTFSAVQAGQQIDIDSRILAPAMDVASESQLPFAVLLQYRDSRGAEHSDSQTVQITLRPRAFAEITTEGGVWVGGFFIAPYVSLGTIIGVPAGALLTVLLRRRRG